MSLVTGGSGGGSGSAVPSDGWVASTGWSYSSADAPTFVISTVGDLSTVIPVGAKIKLTQTTPKYFIVTAITSSTITVYGGTDYTLVNAAITSPFWSPTKAPFGFPGDPAKWSVDATNNTSDSAKAAPTVSTWYGETGLSATGPSIVIPIGSWRVFYDAIVDSQRAANGTVEVRTTLSTANNTQSDTTMTAILQNTPSAQGIFSALHRERWLTLAAKTTYYLNIMTTAAGLANIDIRGDVSPVVIRAVCAYL